MRPIRHGAKKNIEVHIAMADGREKVWTLPVSILYSALHSAHRWRKLKENLLADKAIRPDFAHWVVREITRPGDHPVRVDMLLQTEDLCFRRRE